MNEMQQLPRNHPLVMAFEAYQETDRYKNSRKWATHPNAVDGSLWAAFEEGWREALLRQNPPNKSLQGTTNLGIWQRLQAAIQILTTGHVG